MMQILYSMISKKVNKFLLQIKNDSRLEKTACEETHIFSPELSTLLKRIASVLLFSVLLSFRSGAAFADLGSAADQCRDKNLYPKVRYAACNKALNSGDVLTEDAPSIHLQIARYHEEQKRFDVALEVYDRLISTFPHYALGYIGRGQLHLRRREHDLAINDLAEAIRLDPELQIAYFLRGSIYHVQGLREKSLSDLNEAVRLNPNDARSHSTRAVLLADIGQYDAATSDIEHAIDLAPDDAFVRGERGAVFRRKGNLDEAIKDFEFALSKDPTLAFVYFERGTAYARKNDYEQAIIDFDQTLKLNPNDDLAHYNKAVSLEALGKTNAALQSYGQAVSANPRFKEAFYNKAILLWQKGLHSGAVNEFEAVLGLAPNSPRALNGLVWILSSTRDATIRNGPRAVRLAHKLLKLSDIAEDHAAYAAALAETGDFPGAIEEQQKAINKSTVVGRPAMIEAFSRMLVLFKANRPYRLEEFEN